MFGANPPPDLAWQVGKTAASIRFVNDAQAWIAARFGAEADRKKLQEAIAEVKEGSRVIEDWTEPEEFLDQY